VIVLVLFAISVAFIVYTYLLFPLLIAARGSFLPRPYEEDPILPNVSILIACHNEEANIEQKLRNLFALDYPADRLQLIVMSDGSTDATESIVDAFSEPVTLLRLPRRGKAAALNAGALEATGEILVFSDANSMYDEDAIRMLVRPFADDRVGGVAGDQRYDKGRSASSIQQGEQRYWNFDRWLKRQQSRAGSVTSATGAIYAIRRELFEEVPGGVTDDFFISTQVVAKGYRLVFAENAIAREPVAASGGKEFQRKVRLMTRGLRGVVEMRRLLNPLRYGFYSLQLFSHKVLRRLVVFALIVLALTSPLLWQEGIAFEIATIAQLMFYATAALAHFARASRSRLMKVLSLPAFFVLANTAAFLATLNLLRGRRIEFWTPQR
jgi:cellulose synthase/poly-beta-1,6-N-acetylglucosamine synthase-like glycosyltransferase